MRIPWKREELMILLKKYSEIKSGDMHKTHPEIIKISKEIRALPFNLKYSELDRKFRNPNAIALKFANILFIDPRYLGKGMKGASKLDKIIFEEYFSQLSKFDNSRLIFNDSHELYSKHQKDQKVKNNCKYPYDFKKWFSSNIGGVRLPMNNKSGRPIGDQIIEGNIHGLIREMIVDFKKNKGRYLCVLVGGPGNGKTDLMEFASEVLFDEFKIDSSVGKKILQDGFEINNRKAKYQNNDIALNLIQDASQRNPNDSSPIDSLFNDFEDLYKEENVLTLICVNRGILENTVSKSKKSTESISKYEEIISKIHLYNNIQAIINNSKIWGDEINGVKLFTWSMDFDTLFKEDEDEDNNLIKDLIDKSKCLDAFYKGHNFSPIQSAKLFLSNRNQIFNLSQLLRYSEILNGKRFTYRELFSLVAHLFHHSEEDTLNYENMILNYEKLNDDECVKKFNILFQLYRKNPSYRFFNYFLEPKKNLFDSCIKPYKGDKQDLLKQMFSILSNDDYNLFEIPYYISSKGSSIFDPIYYDENHFKLKNDLGDSYELKNIIDKILYNQSLDSDSFSKILQPIEIELIKLLEKIKDSYCLSIDYDDYNTTQLNGVDLFKTYLNNLIISIFKRSILFSNFFIRDKNLIKEYLYLVQHDSSSFINVLQESLTIQNKIENSLSTSIGQTISELKNNIIEKSNIMHIDSLPRPTNKMPSSDQIILTYSIRGNSAPGIIVITYNLFKSIKKNESQVFSACLDKNYLLWQELKKIELSNRSSVSGGEIFIPDMGGKRIKLTRNPFNIQIL